MTRAYLSILEFSVDIDRSNNYNRIIARGGSYQQMVILCRISSWAFFALKSKYRVVRMDIRISETRDIEREKIIALYKANGWSAAEKADELHKALRNSHALVTAWDGDKLVGLGNAISDGYLVVYYPHLLVHPEYQGEGIGKKIVARMRDKYSGFHMQMLVADGEAIDFYEKVGFVRAGKTQAMWIYKGNEH